MKDWQFYALLAFMFTAPHVPRKTARWLALASIVIALIAWFA